MKISYISDLHFEYNPSFELNNDDNSDVLILAGDITTSKEMNKLQFWFDDIHQKWKDIIYVFGNHEYYGDYLYNVPDYQVTDNIHFISLTLWLPCNEYDCLELLDTYSHRRMKDSQMKSHCYNKRALAKKFSENLSKFNFRDKIYLEDKLKNIDQDSKVVVITHFPPVKKCSQGSPYPYHQFFQGNLDDFLKEKKFKIDYWIYGHSHYNREDFEQYGIKFICNQDTKRVKTFEI
jgi:predicted phosphohydrolase